MFLYQIKFLLKVDLKSFLKRIVDVGPVPKRRLRGDLVLGLPHFLEKPVLCFLELAQTTLEEYLLVPSEAVFDVDHRAERHVGEFGTAKHSVVLSALLAELGGPLFV